MVAKLSSFSKCSCILTSSTSIDLNPLFIIFLGFGGESEAVADLEILRGGFSLTKMQAQLDLKKL